MSRESNILDFAAQECEDAHRSVQTVLRDYPEGLSPSDAQKLSSVLKQLAAARKDIRDVAGRSE